MHQMDGNESHWVATVLNFPTISKMILQKFLSILYRFWVDEKFKKEIILILISPSDFHLLMMVMDKVRVVRAVMEGECDQLKMEFYKNSPPCLISSRIPISSSFIYLYIILGGKGDKSVRQGSNYMKFLNFAIYPP